MVYNFSLKWSVLEDIHSSPTMGHFSIYKTYEQTKHSIFWEGMKNRIHTFVVECDAF